MASTTLNAADLIRSTVADLESRRAELQAQLDEVKRDLKQHVSALALLTGAAAPGSAVTKALVRDELIQILREMPGQAIPREELEKTLKQRIKEKQVKLTNFGRRLDEVLRDGNDIEMGEGDVVTLTTEGGQRAAT